MKTISKDVHSISGAIKDFLVGEGKDKKEAKAVAVALAEHLAMRFNGDTLYLSIDMDKINRNKDIIRLREKRGMTLEQISKTLDISKSTVYSVVMKADSVLISGKFSE